MNVPLFAPSLALLREWHTEHDQMWEMHYGWPQRHGDLAGSTDMPDPGSDEKKSFDFWVSKSDFYTLPHIVTFDSWKDLLSKLESTDLAAVSEAMKRENSRTREHLVREWSKIHDKISRS